MRLVKELNSDLRFCQSYCTINLPDYLAEFPELKCKEVILPTSGSYQVQWNQDMNAFAARVESGTFSWSPADAYISNPNVHSPYITGNTSTTTYTCTFTYGTTQYNMGSVTVNPGGFLDFGTNPSVCCIGSVRKTNDVSCADNLIDPSTTGKDITYKFKVHGANSNVNFKDLRVSTAETQFENTSKLYYIDAFGEPQLIDGQVAGNGITWEVLRLTIASNSGVANELDFVLTIDATNTNATGNFVAQVGYSSNFNGTNCCRMAVANDVAFDQIKIEPTAPKVSAIHIYPNPSNGLFTIEGLSSSDQNVEVSDLTGKSFTTFKCVNKTLDLSKLAKGIYRIKLYDGSEFTNHKVVIH